ncbi:hypothetical protein P3T36_005425 [Kitasatospora sp. MAP12-15]|uniref:DUF4232 domain-containing protein n=1 Tax=unclassified Kitasatospora TaxID=2633591 RepID=UPI00247588B6|nr:DUF4232 domain-containing protein [Kitasatospora sp. MAP12-44]MDH6109774.1 hypothetical protein [Kitasatospora sp. MAP12-44]
MRVQRAMAASVLAVVAGMALTACQGSVSGSVTTTGGGQSNAAQAGAGTGGSGSSGNGSSGNGSSGTGSSSGGSKTAGKGPSGSAAGSQCTTANLGITTAVGKGTPPEADMASVSVSFTNKGSASCTLDGFPGVDLTTGAGPTSVPRGRHQGSAVTLAAGASTQSVIWFRTNPPGHTSIKVTGMTITPPGETHSVKLDWPGAPFANAADDGGTDTLYLEPVGYHG